LAALDSGHRHRGSAAALVVFGFWIPRESKHSPSADKPQAEEPLDYTVAVLVHAPNAAWEDVETAPRTGAPLAPGWLRLKSGFAQLEFYSGATVILEGPAEFELISRMEGYCKRGKLRATVPPHAHGFAIRTPKLELVDLGTDFGIQVDEGQRTEVHVFTGKVELYDADSNRAADSRKELTTGQGLLFKDPGMTNAVPTTAGVFHTARDLVAHTEAQTRRRHEQWLATSFKLRTDPALVAYYPFQAAEPWSRTLPDEARDHQEPFDGAIVGATWSEGRWPGKQGLEFKQVSDRVRVHIPGEFTSLTLMAWVRIDGLPNLNNSLLMSDGWEPGELHWQIINNGMLVLGVQSDPKSRGWHYDSPEVLTPDYFGRWIHLAMVYNQDAGLVTHYLEGRPVAVLPIPVDLPLRLGDAEIGNWNIASHKNITPVRFFSGCMDEIMVFSRALSEQEIETMHAQGQPLN
jgi:hypothetical protein